MAVLGEDGLAGDTLRERIFSRDNDRVIANRHPVATGISDER
jgi:hypothetical protein